MDGRKIANDNRIKFLFHKINKYLYKNVLQKQNIFSHMQSMVFKILFSRSKNNISILNRSVITLNKQRAGFSFPAIQSAACDTRYFTIANNCFSIEHNGYH